MAKENNARIKNFKLAVEQSLSLGEEEKKFWLSKADSLHPDLAKMLTRLVKTKEREMWKYIGIAIMKKPSLLAELGAKMKKIRREVLSLEEKGAGPSAEDLLEKELEDIPE